MRKINILTILVLAMGCREENIKMEETALIGKWGSGSQDTAGNPLKKGFDSYYGYLDQVLAHNYYPEYLLRIDKKEMLRNTEVHQDNTAGHKGLGSHSENSGEDNDIADVNPQIVQELTRLPQQAHYPSERFSGPEE